MKIKYVYISIALHLLLLTGLFLNKQETNPTQKTPPSFVSMEHGTEEKPKTPKEVEIIPKIPNGDTVKPCKKFYYGIGFIHGRGGEVMEVYEGYPAYDGGLLKGDYVENIVDIPHKDGVSFILKIRRNGQLMTNRFTTTKICTN